MNVSSFHKYLTNNEDTDLYNNVVRPNKIYNIHSIKSKHNSNHYIEMYSPLPQPSMSTSLRTAIIAFAILELLMFFSTSFLIFPFIIVTLFVAAFVLITLKIIAIIDSLIIATCCSTICGVCHRIIQILGSLSGLACIYPTYFIFTQFSKTTGSGIKYIFALSVIENVLFLTCNILSHKGIKIPSVQPYGKRDFVYATPYYQPPAKMNYAVGMPINGVHNA
eukprot:TRINITY_DN1617_c0_g1_i16.p1 TRINITY_DN1617_c0_g1~~TRINITY_DN1617_c0_g1_i16.p1  ORF type:complete len:221 (+),score=6.78 TRINITY_DN1617_c0_g1_i16:92-754(+)